METGNPIQETGNTITETGQWVSISGDRQWPISDDFGLEFKKSWKSSSFDISQKNRSTFDISAKNLYTKTNSHPKEAISSNCLTRRTVIDYF